MSDDHARTSSRCALSTAHRLSRRTIITRATLGASLAAVSGVLAATGGAAAINDRTQPDQLPAAVPTLPKAPKAYIGLFKDNAIAVFDTRTSRVLHLIPIPVGPHGLVLSADGQTVYASSDGASTLSVIDTDADAVAASIEVGQAPHGLALTPDGQLLLSAVFGTSQVVFIDTATNKITGMVPVPQPHNIAISPDGRLAYVAAQQMGATGLTILDIGTMKAMGNVPLEKTPRALNFNPDGSQLYFTLAGVDSVQVLDPATNKITTQIPVGASPHHPLITATGEYGLTVVQGPGQLAIIDPTKNIVIGTAMVGKMPHWVASSGDGDTAWVTNENSNDVTIVDVEHQSVIATVPVGNAPRKIVVQPGAVAPPLAMVPMDGMAAAMPMTGMMLGPTVTTPMGNAAMGAVGGTSVRIAGFAFAPDVVTLKPGQSVTWMNNDSVTHTVTSNDGAWDSGNIASGASFSHTFDQEGTFAYHCAIHPFMMGTVTVKN